MASRSSASGAAPGRIGRRRSEIFLQKGLDRQFTDLPLPGKSVDLCAGGVKPADLPIEQPD
jgi:hypothetical protein